MNHDQHIRENLVQFIRTRGGVRDVARVLEKHFPGKYKETWLRNRTSKKKGYKITVEFLEDMGQAFGEANLYLRIFNDSNESTSSVNENADSGIASNETLLLQLIREHQTSTQAVLQLADSVLQLVTEIRAGKCLTDSD